MEINNNNNNNYYYYYYNKALSAEGKMHRGFRWANLRE
jgi:hypothetical protein